MLAGHFATALVAIRQERDESVSGGLVAFYLAASQLPDLLWLALHFTGVEPSPPANPMAISLDSTVAPMHYSHDLVPLLFWIGATVLCGRLAFGRWRPGWVGAGLVLVHELCDLVSGFPHYVWGPDSLEVGTGLYLTAPYLAVGIEAVFTLGVLAWLVRAAATRSTGLSARTWATWALVFGGGLAFMFGSADLSMADLGFEPLPALDGTGMATMVAIYGGMLATLIWDETRPTPRQQRPARASAVDSGT